MKSKKKKRNGIFSLLLICIMFLTACGNTGTANNEDGSAVEDISVSAIERPMGRYIEETYNLPKNLGAPKDMIRLDNGNLAVLDLSKGLFTSEDDGKTWEDHTPEWFPDYVYGSNINYLIDAALSTNGKITVIYMKYPEPDEEVNSSGLQNDPEIRIFDLEGNQIPVDIQTTGEKYPNHAWAGPDGKVYLIENGATATYELNTEDGSFRKIVAADRGVYYGICVYHKMLLFMEDGLCIYDTETEETTNDSVLFDLIQKEISQDAQYLVNGKEFCVFEGEEEDIVYVAVRSGLYRHVIGGTAMEQVIDGSLCSMSSPSKLFNGGILLENSEFLIGLGNQMIRYHYDETVPTVPDKTITAYSLEKNEVILQAINLYQTKHPDVYVKYEIGLEGESGITKEDAIKKLNTEMMAGNGPDVLLLDGLPAKSYQEKGLLMDIAPYLDEMEEPLFENMKNVYADGDAIYGMPAQFIIPYIQGKEEDIQRISDISSLADAAERAREKKHSGSILDFFTPELTLQSLNMVCLPALVKEDGSLDEEMLFSYLTDAKRIYYAESIGISAEELRQKEETITVYGNDYTGKGYIPFFGIDISNKVFNLVGEEILISAGYLSDIGVSYDLIKSVEENYPEYSSGPWNGLSRQVYLPNTIIAVNVKTQQEEEAVEFVQTVLSSENLSINLSYGFPVNETALRKYFSEANGQGGEYYGSFSIGHANSDSDSFLSLDIRGLKEQEEEELVDLIESLTTPNAGEEILEDVILEVGVHVLTGDITVEEGVNQIKQKVAIYLAE